MSVNDDKIETLHLKEIFEYIIRNDDIKVTLENLSEIIDKDLNLQIDHLSSSQLISLPYMLINYIKKWPGWDKQSEYENGTLDLDAWYKRFRSYVLYKMSLLISKTLGSIEKELQREIEETKKSKRTDNCTQLANQASFSNFNIELSGPATLLGNLVFWGIRDNITIEEHSNRQWAELSCDVLVNFPFVEVEFNSPELSFKRSFEPKINRYISGSAASNIDRQGFIIGKHTMNLSNAEFTFNTSVLQEYIKCYKEVMYSQITMAQKVDVDVVLDQFYQDIVDISSSDLVAENRQVTFNIGKNVYKRSKKIANDPEDESKPTVIYNEIFLPKVVSSFRYFTGMQEYTLEGKRVVSAKANSSKIMMTNFKPIILYKCTYCKVSFSGPNGRANILSHLEYTHNREQPLLCLLCKKSFELVDLARRRWKCQCQE